LHPVPFATFPPRVLAARDRKRDVSLRSHL